MSDAERDRQELKLLLDPLVEELTATVTRGVMEELEASGLFRQVMELIEGLQERVEKLQAEVERLKAVPSSRVAMPPSRATTSSPAIVPRRNRTPSRPTVTYRSDPRAGSETSSVSEDKTCSETGCSRPVRARGKCSLHYQRMRYRERKIEQKRESIEPLPPPPPPAVRTESPSRRRNGGTRGVFALLYEERGRKVLAGLINQMKFERADLVRRLNEMHAGMPGIPLEEEDVLRVVHYHQLGDVLQKRECEIICRHLAKLRGSLGKTAQKMKMDRGKLENRIGELQLQVETSRIRNGFKEEILEQYTFTQRLDLALTREKYLEDLGIVEEVDASLRRELDTQIERLTDGPPTEDASQSVRAALALDEERYRRLLKRFDIGPDWDDHPVQGGP